MPTKQTNIFQCRVIADKTLLNRLQFEHRLFNEKLAGLIQLILAAERGDLGKEWKFVVEKVLLEGAQHGGEFWYAFAAGGKLRPSRVLNEPRSLWWAEVRHLYDTKTTLAPKNFFAGLAKRRIEDICQQAHEVITSYRGQLALWNKEYSEWVDARAKWEAEHPDYMRVRHKLREFEAVYGALKGSRNRWSAYIDWLATRPDLASWRTLTPINAIDDSGRRRVEESAPRKRTQTYSEEFFKVNPELKELSDLDEFFRENYSKFRRRPTFTLPSADNPRHPRYASGQYTILDTGRVKLNDHKLIVPFHMDSRLLKSGLNLKDTTFNFTECGRTNNLHLRALTLEVTDQGAYFTWSAAPEKAIPRRTTAVEKINNRPCITGDCRILAVDWGISNEIWYVVIDYQQGKTTISESGRVGTGLLPKIKNDEWRLRRKKRQRGAPVHNEQHCIKLKSHIRNSKAERARLLSGEVIKLAVKHSCDIVAVEQLDSLRTSLKYDRAKNRSLSRLNTQKFYDHLGWKAYRMGIYVKYVNPFGTSTTCPRCREIAVRVNDTPDGFKYAPYGGKLVHCIDGCGYTGNSDHVGAVGIGLKAIDYNYTEKLGQLNKKERQQLKEHHRKLLEHVECNRAMVA